MVVEVLEMVLHLHQVAVEKEGTTQAIKHQVQLTQVVVAVVDLMVRQVVLV